MTLLELVAALDHKTLSSIERWLEQSKLRAQSARRGSVTDATCAGDVTEQAQVVEPGVRGTDAPDTSQESMAALTIQSQVWTDRFTYVAEEASPFHNWMESSINFLAMPYQRELRPVW